MRTSIILIVAAVGLGGGCGQVSADDETTATTELVRAAPPTVSVTTAPPTPGAAPTAAPTTAPTGASTPTTIRTTTTRPATTTTTRPLTRAEATSNLCASVASADEAIQRGNFVAGGLRLSSGIGRNEKAADAAVLAAARSMLRAGLNGSAEDYVTARSTASTACARAGYPIQLSGPIMCVQAPCP